MKKITLSLAMAAVSVFGLSMNADAQRGVPYSNGLGLMIDFGDGSTLVGPHIKHFFNQHDAGQLEVLFGNSTTYLGAEYTYNAPIRSVRGLFWNVGLGAQVALYSGGSDFILRPIGGLEYRFADAPIALGFDWRPAWTLTHGSDFTGARFGLTGKFTF